MVNLSTARSSPSVTGPVILKNAQGHAPSAGGTALLSHYRVRGVQLGCVGERGCESCSFAALWLAR